MTTTDADHPARERRAAGRRCAGGDQIWWLRRLAARRRDRRRQPLESTSPPRLRSRSVAGCVLGSEAPLTGRWRIVEMSGWDRDAIDLVAPGYIEFTRDGSGQIGFIAVRGWLDCCPLERNGRVGVEFTWAGVDEGDPVCGRGWAVRVDGETIEGHVFFHLGDDSTFRAEPFPTGGRVDGQ